MASKNICSACGGKDMNLVSGYYYCVECGTQNMTIRETIVDNTTRNDGTLMYTNTKKIILKDNIEMTTEWHKWHTYNFIMAGLAEELISLGAKPSFKMKLLWIWTRYVHKVSQTSNGNDKDTSVELSDENVECENDAELDNEDDTVREKEDYKPGTYTHNTDINTVTISLLHAMCYIALNLDKSEIQLSDLCRFIREEKVSRRNCMRFIPKELKVNSIPKWHSFIRSTDRMCTYISLKSITLMIFKKLDLGSPCIPDFYKIINKFVLELCLPNDFTKIVLSLAEYVRFNFDDSKTKVVAIHDYETLAMAYIVMAMKICFGLDDDYEIKLSETVDKINTEECRFKSYKGMFYDYSQRLFCFREWCNYMELRKLMLSKYNFHMAIHNNQEIDDEVFIYQTKDRVKQNTAVNVSDNVIISLLEKIESDTNYVKLTEIDFKGSLTPLTSYTDTLISHCEDPELKLALSEDFSSYSLDYFLEDMSLKVDGKNILIGVNKMGKIVGSIHKKNMFYNLPLIYVRNCENKNWMITKPPKAEHITKIKENNIDIDDNDAKFDLDISFKNPDSSNESLKPETKCEALDEEIDLSIFDDTFEDVKTENNMKQVNEERHEDENLNSQIDRALEEKDRNGFTNDDESDVETGSPIPRPQFDPNSFDRNEIIKSLIEMKCEEYKIPLPNDMKPKVSRKRKLNTPNEASKSKLPKTRTKQTNDKKPLHDIVTSYLTKLENDFTTTVVGTLENAIRNSLQHSTLLNSESHNFDAPLEGAALSKFINISDRIFNNNSDDENKDGKSVVEVDNETVSDNQESESLQPKSNPEFDENVYDINQLYVKLKERQNEEVFMETDSHLDDIVMKNIENIKHRNVISEEEVLADCNKEEKSKKLPYLINSRKSIHKYRYWLRHYGNVLRKNRRATTVFEKELNEFFPHSFSYILRTCASILETSSLSIYSQLEILENRLIQLLN